MSLLPFLLYAQVAAAQQVPAIVSRAPVAAGASVAFHAMVIPDTVYLGEQATYQIAVFLDDQVRARMRRNPEFVPPELRSLVSYDLPLGTGRMYQRDAGGKRYEVHVFERALFGLTGGRIQIPPAQLLYSLPLSASFFSREESHALRSETALLTVREPPLEGRPPDYSGAIGILALDARFDSRSGRTGDPFVLTVGVRGEANVAHLPRPAIEVPWGTAVPASERVRLDSSAVRLRGLKEFDWILTPRDSGVLKLPQVKYWFFNPVAERYELAVADAESLVVKAGTLAMTDTASSRSLLPLRPAFTGELPPPIPERPWFWLLAIAAPLPAIGRVVFAAIERKRRPQRAERLLRSLARRKALDPARVRRAYVQALADRLLIPAETLTRRGELARMLRLSGVRSRTAREADDLLAELDEAIYADVQRPASEDAGERAFGIVRTVDREAIRKILLMVAVAVTFTALSPAHAGPARDVAIRAAFDRGVQQYARGEYSAAVRTFADVTQEAPRAPDAWANFGTAGFAASDTAAASVGWQRALRLEPRASDVREHIELLGTTERGFVSIVPPVTSSEMAAVALTLWLALWGILFLSTEQRRTLIPAIALYSMIAGVVLTGVAAGAIGEIEKGVRLAVVSEGGMLRTLPALGADRGSIVLTGEVARTRARQGVWTRVELDGGRHGWVETQRLVPLGG